MQEVHPAIQSHCRTPYALTRHDTTFLWTSQCQAAFDDLKSILSEAPILRLPDPTRPFILMTDASDRQIGDVLLQADLTLKELHPIQYMSRTIDSIILTIL